ncbi:MAG: MFS transporter [Pseudomonadota bacterium]
MLSYLSFIRQNWPLLGFGFLTVFWGNFGQSFFIAWFGAAIQQDLSLSAGTYGTAYSVATLMAALTVVWAGGLVDRMSLRRYVSLVGIGLCMACLVLFRADSLWMLFLGLFLLRLFGQSLFPHTGMVTMSRQFEQARGRAISIAMSGVPAGEILLPMVAVSLIALVGWQGTFALIGIGTGLLLVPSLWWLLRHSRPALARHAVNEERLRTERAGKEEQAGSRRHVLTDHRFWLALPALMTTPFMVTGIFIHQSFLVESKGWTLSWLALCFTLYGVVHWISSLASGMLVDRFGAPRLLPLLQLPMLGALLVAAFMPGWWSAPVMLVLLGMAAGGSPPVTGSLWPLIYGTAHLGAIRSMNMALMVGATSVSPVLFGRFIDAGVSAESLFGYSGLYVVVALLLVSFSYPRDDRARVA